MIAAVLYKGKTVLVLGLGKSGNSLARSLKAGGAAVTVWDDSETALVQAGHEGWNILRDGNTLPDTVTMVAVSPGIAPSHPLLVQARQAGVPVRTDLDILYQHCPHAVFAGITGTNGKSTTTALLGHVLKAAGMPAEVVGNIGVPVLEATPTAQTPVFVIEASSYQLEYSKDIRFSVAIHLNLTPDHLERHGTIEAYGAAKKRIFRDMGQGCTAIIGVDDTSGQELLKAWHNVGTTIIPISCQKTPATGIGVDGTFIRDGRTGQTLADMTALPRLPGRHNAQNVAAVCAAALAMGVKLPVLQQALASFPGLPHRQEWCGEVQGIPFINDSKATNADATEKALCCYENIYWIAGGRAKTDGIDPLVSYFSRIRKAYLIGEAANRFAALLEQYKVPYQLAGTLDVAVQGAHDDAIHDALPGSVVLLSPACASFDQFSSFEHRGDVFREQVKGLLRKEG